MNVPAHGEGKVRRSPEDLERRANLHGFSVSAAIGYLERLIPLLVQRGFVAHIEPWPSGPPILRVSHHSQPEWPGGVLADCSVTTDMHVSEDVHPAETWFYWWEWAERIGPATDLHGVVDNVASLLTPREFD